MFPETPWVLDPPALTLRALREEDIEVYLRYPYESDPEFLESIGFNLASLPGRERHHQLLQDQVRNRKPSDPVSMLVLAYQGSPIGHFAVNGITPGTSASFHLHIWREEFRGKGLARPAIRRAMAYFMDAFQVPLLVMEPSVSNTRVNRLAQSLGARLVKTYTTQPSPATLTMLVNRYEMSAQELENAPE